MKLQLSLLKKVIDLPDTTPTAVRAVLDDLGLEVKNMEGDGDETLFTIETLANRGDHLSAYGVARELSARLLTAPRAPALARELPTRRPAVPVTLLSKQCLRYALLEMQIPRDLSLPGDIGGLLGSSAVGPTVIVDLLNYVQKELGQPMHAFDFEKVEGEIIVRELEAAEEITALDGKKYTVPVGALVICDRKKILAVAGVIGCANSMVTETTGKVLIESATFDPVSVRLTARAMGISTDASYAFERGCDRELPPVALKRVVHLTEGAGGAVQGAAAAHALGVVVVEGTDQEKRVLSINLRQIREQLNAPRLPEAEIVARLKYLGFAVEAKPIEKAPNDKLLTVTVPSWRWWDLKNPEDLVEECARVVGYNSIRLDLPPLDYEVPALHEFEDLRRRLEVVLVGNGFFEVITKAFCSGDIRSALGEFDTALPQKHISLKNSVESMYAHLKTTNIVHLAEVADQNVRRGVSAVKIFEFGRVFSAEANPDARYEHERDLLTLGIAGRWSDHDWRVAESRDVLMAHVKGILEAIATVLGGELKLVAHADRLLHPGFQARVKIGRSDVGIVGMIHPGLKDRLQLGTDLIYVELEVDKLIRALSAREVQLPSDFPSIRRDLTLKVPLREFATRVVDVVTALKLSDLIDIDLVDDFRKQDEDFRRVSYRFTFQRRDRTLAHGEVDTAMQSVRTTLEEKGISLA